ncbi:MAG: 23S rRNA (adenine(2503)-C(2))-methyltransferase RlmN [Chitinispirillales bacterium]|jgi:23S rRNA (adenine2503-C2)-methyltransferase|nr:23S rRNA (adenine(2503)-C(2))-methyltransferase RlmN [Chitinispirillales bacterium]
MQNLKNLKNLTLLQLEDFVLSLGEQRFRAKQIFKWMYQKRLPDFSEMTNMPKALRASLSERASIAKLRPVRVLESSVGDAVKFAFALEDSDYAVESVLLTDGDRRTACLSSQLGCGLGCAFCETAKLGFIRNLTPSEILGQLVGMNDYQAARGDRVVTNIVFMGMGEALGNYENFMTALSVIMHEDAFNVGARRITVSTAGVVPHIDRLMGEGLTIGLAISLNAWNDGMRGELMPINRKYPIASLVEAAKRYYGRTGRRVTFEYVLIEGKTDTAEAAEALFKLLGGFPCKVNLIPVNPVDPGLSAPGDGAVQRFADALYERGVAATIRKSRGRDVFGACGQLTAELVKSKSF